MRREMRRARLRHGCPPFGLKLFKVARQKLLLLFPVAAEADRLGAEGKGLAVDVARGRHYPAPGFERAFFEGDSLIERPEVAGILIKVVADAGEQALGMVL